MAQKNTVFAVPLSTFSSASVSGSYQVVNTGGLPNACFFLRIVNDSTKAVTVSYDGTNDHEYIPANTVSAPLEVNAETNAQPKSVIALFPIGFTVWIKGTAGTGTISVSGYYQPLLK